MDEEKDISNKNHGFMQKTDIKLLTANPQK